MIIPDTNIIIDFWHTGDMAKANIFRSQQIALCGIIRTELLRGARSQKEFDNIKNAIANFPVYDMDPVDWDSLGWELSQLRTHGITVPFQDAIIAHLAIKHSATVWTNDKHFTFITNILPDLKLLDENGFSPAEVEELKRRVEDINNGNVEPHPLIDDN